MNLPVFFNGEPVVERDLPIGCPTALSLAMRMMREGDEIFIEKANTNMSVYRSIKQFAKRNGLNISAETTPYGMRAWRVE